MDEREYLEDETGPRHYAAIHWYGGNYLVHAGQALDRDLRAFVARLTVRYGIPFDVARRLADDCRRLPVSDWAKDALRVPLRVACAHGPATPDGEEYLTIVACECDCWDVPHYDETPAEWVASH